MISVVIPIYNTEPFISQAVESALAQPETGEVILVEDCSTDNSLVVCRQFVDRYPQVRLIRHPGGRNRGLSASRNLGILETEYEYIAFLDSDDFYLPGRFELTRDILDKYRDIDGVYEAVGVYFENEQLRQSYFVHRNKTMITLNNSIPPDRLFEEVLIGKESWFQADGLTVRRSIFDRTGLFDEHLRMHEDTAMWTKMAALGRLTAGRLDSPVAILRVHGGNMFRLTPHKKMIKSRILLWKTVYEWGRQKQLSLSRQNILLGRFLDSQARAYGENPRIMHILCVMFRLISTAILDPSIVRFHAFWRFAFEYSGIRGIGRRIYAIFEPRSQE